MLDYELDAKLDKFQEKVVGTYSLSDGFVTTEV